MKPPSGPRSSVSIQSSVSSQTRRSSWSPLTCQPCRYARASKRVVVQHLLEVRDQPAGVHGVAREAAAHLVVHAAAGHGAQGVEAHPPSRPGPAGTRSVEAGGNLGAPPKPPCSASYIRRRPSTAASSTPASSASAAGSQRRRRPAGARPPCPSWRGSRRRARPRPRAPRPAPWSTRACPGAPGAGSRYRRSRAPARGSGTRSAATRPGRSWPGTPPCRSRPGRAVPHGRA